VGSKLSCLCNVILSMIYLLNEKMGAAILMYSQLPPELATESHIVGRTLLEKMKLYHRIQEQLQGIFTAADKLPLQELLYAEDTLVWGKTSIAFTDFMAFAQQILEACELSEADIGQRRYRRAI